jgi:hypothetical protein
MERSMQGNAAKHCGKKAGNFLYSLIALWLGLVLSPGTSGVVVA